MIDLSKYPTTITKKLMANNKLAISFSIPKLEDFAVGTFLDVDGERYYLNRPAVIEKGGKDIWKYSLSLEADSYLLLRKRFLFGGSRKFSILGNLEFFIDLIISNINETYPTWTKGNIDTTENKTLSFDSVDCRGALNQIAKEFEVEFDIINRVITAKKQVGQYVGYTFEYGKGKGLYQLTRKNVDSKETVTRVYGFGSSKNLPSDYGQTELTFAEKYVEDFSEFSDIIEADYVNEDIFPSFTGAVTAVTPDWLTITVPSMDFNLLNQLNAGQEAKVVCRSGDMLGREFVIKENSYNDATKTFTLIADTDESGTTFPNDSMHIRIGDTITFVDIHMPQSYVDEAEAKLKTKTREFLEQNKSVRVVYDLTLDPRYLSRNNITLKPGDIVTIIDADFGIHRNIRLSATTKVQANSLMTSFKATISDFVPISQQNRLIAKTIENTKRTEIVNSSNIELARKNTLKNRLLQDRLFDTDDFFDTDNIKPLSINTSFLSVGAKSQNFQLDNCKFEANYLADENRFVASAGVLRHLEVSGDAGKNWTISSLDQSGLKSSSFYYLYAKCSKTTDAGVWVLSTSQEQADQTNYYYFLVGILYEVINGFRQSSFTYGSTYINGRTITTGRIVSIDGQNYFDLDSGQFKIGDSTSSLDWNVTRSGQLTLKGALVQNPEGSTSGLPVFRGAYSGGTTYYRDDRVTYNGETWRYINATPSSGNTPTEGVYWTIEAAKGDIGASPVYQGDYNNGKTYYGNSTRVDIVKYSGAYYVARADAGTFSGVLPTDKSRWKSFGASFDSVATSLLFATLAYIENLGVRNLKTSDSGQRVEITAGDNSIKFYDSNGHEKVSISDSISGVSVGIRLTDAIMMLDKPNFRTTIRPEFIISPSIRGGGEVVSHWSTNSGSPTQLDDFEFSNTYYAYERTGPTMYVTLPNIFNIEVGTEISIGTGGRDVKIQATSGSPLRWDSSGGTVTGTYTLHNEVDWVHWRALAGAWTKVSSGNY